MSKHNPFSDLVAEKSEKVPKEKVVTSTTVKSVRARKRSEVQITTFRLNAEDHVAIRQLAFRDGQFMNELIVAALREYCDKRGVKLTTLA